MSSIAIFFLPAASTVDLFVFVVAALSGIATAAGYGYSPEYMQNTSTPTYREGAQKKYPILSKLS